MGIFPKEGYQEPFTVPTCGDNCTDSYFQGSGWRLKNGLTYGAYYPFDVKCFERSDAKKKIAVNYSGQCQVGRDCCISAFDYTFSDWETVTDDSAHFTFHHLGALYAVELTLPATADYQEVSLLSGKYSIPYYGHYDLTAEKPVFVMESNSTYLRMTLKEFSGVSGEPVWFYFMLPPMDMSKDVFSLELYSKTLGKTFKFNLPSKIIEAGKAYYVEAQSEHQFVDLGLSVKWATCNLGASVPQGYGDYYAWGASEPYYYYPYAQESPCKYWKDNYTGYDWNSYPFCIGSTMTDLTRYCTVEQYGLNGFCDGKKVLEGQDDIVREKYGDKWHIPTAAQFEELMLYTSKQYFTDYNGTGVAGYALHSTKEGYTDRSIFLPSSGYRFDSGLFRMNAIGPRLFYWTNELDSNYPYNAKYMEVGQGHRVPYDNINSIYRCYGLPIRPVCE